MNRRAKILGALFVLLVLATAGVWLVVLTQKPKELTVAFLDVGQGDAIYIESPTGRQVLIDGGKGKAVLRELGAVMPFFDRSIDVVLATHPDQDHIGGLPFVLENYEVGTVIRSGYIGESATFETFSELIKKEGAKEVQAVRTMVVHLGGGVHLDILSPQSLENITESNDASIITRLVYGESEVMLTGDAPKWVENILVQMDGENIQSDILKAGHHGSKTSTASTFVGLVNPDIGIISAGKDNRYGHPHQEVLDMFKMFEIPLMQTVDGRIVCKTKGEEWKCK